jgi:hypothetical protein
MQVEALYSKHLSLFMFTTKVSCMVLAMPLFPEAWLLLASVFILIPFALEVGS